MNTFMEEVLKKSSAFRKQRFNNKLFLMAQDMEGSISFLGSVLTPVLRKHPTQVLHLLGANRRGSFGGICYMCLWWLPVFSLTSCPSLPMTLTSLFSTWVTLEPNLLSRDLSYNLSPFSYINYSKIENRSACFLVIFANLEITLIIFFSSWLVFVI